MESMLVDALVETCQRFPKRPAVCDDTRVLSYAQLTRLAAAIRGLVPALTQCERIGIALPASTAFPAALFGTLWANRIPIPLNFLLRPQELARIVTDAGIDAIITIRHFASLVSQLPVRASFLEDLPLKRAMFAAMLRRAPLPPRVSRDQTAVILYTSGTSAEPKGVELSFGNLYSNCRDAITSLGIDPGQRFLNILPPFHVFGLTAGVLVPVFLGATVHCLPRFNPIATVRAVEKHRISVLMAIPSMYAAMLRTKSAGPEAFRSLYLAFSGGEPLPDSVRDAFRARFGVTLHQGYGLTETSPIVSACSPHEFREGTVGKPIRNVELRIIGATGKDLTTGFEGEILVRGLGVMKGYFNKPDETRKVIDEAGWFHTGDIGRMDTDGFLSITGRAKEMLIIGGENVFPREIEAVLESHDAVLQAAVIGVPDGLRGEVPVAFVIPKKGEEISTDELRNFARKSLPSFKTPRRIEIREDLPTGPTGKILKRRLRELLG